MADSGSPRGLTVVVKIGSSSLVDVSNGHLALSNVARLVETCQRLRKEGHKVILVTSGAVAVGMRRLGLKERPSEIAKVQALAAVGQGRLMRTFDDLFAEMDLPIAQILLTRTDLSVRSRYLNAQATFTELLAMGVIPIVNENDTVSVSEIRFGDNDTLSGLVAGLLQADWLFLLTDVPALYTANPRLDPDAKPVHLVEDISALAVTTTGTGSSIGTGGMETKLVAARLASAAGCRTGITLGTDPATILNMIAGEAVGTVFLGGAPSGRNRDRKWWLGSLKAEGRLTVDAGASRAILARKSLFAAGITKVEGSFMQQTAVDIVSVDGHVIAKGLVNYTSLEIDLVKGSQSQDLESMLGYQEAAEIIHRANLVLLSPNSPTMDTKVKA